MTTPYTPRLSFVVVARNDDYGGHFLERMQIFLDNLIKLGGELKLQAELIIVEWNPPADRPRLRQVLQMPKLPGSITLRIIEVPREMHASLPNSDRIPLFEYLGKNVGVRRARGEFVMVANPDVFYNESMLHFFSSGKLDLKAFYRVDKYDVGGVTIPSQGTDSRSVLSLAPKNVIRINNRYGEGILKGEKIWSWRNIRRRLSYLKQIARHFPFAPPYANAAGDFFLMSRASWHSLRGYPEMPTHSLMDGYICYMAAALGLRQIILPEPLRIYHFEHHHQGTETRPWTDTGPYGERCLTMLKTQKPWIPNDANWGFGDTDLPEVSLS